MVGSIAIHFFRQGHSDMDLPRNDEGAPTITDELRARLGGKGASLHVLAASGLRVPAGFTITPEACAAFFAAGETWPDGLREKLSDAMAKLEETTGKGDSSGAPLLVAVRSGAAESMPGMMDTILNVATRAEVEDAVRQVFLSWRSDRAVAYRRERGITGLAGTAVTVQEMCDAEFSGVAFSVDPETGDPAVVLEAVAGLGEDLVSGRVTPDRYRFGRPALEFDEISATTGDGVLKVEAGRAVAEIAMRLEEQFDHPVDIEWAIAGGEIHVLQARRVRLADATSARGELLWREAANLKAYVREVAQSGRGGTDELAFVRHNLDETLTHPTPLTWDLVGGLFCGRGGYLGLYEDLGFRPSPRIRKDGLLLCVAGRIYVELDRAAELFYGTGLLRYDAAAVKSNPSLMNEPPSVRHPSAGTPADILRTLTCTLRARRRMAKLRGNFLARFESTLLPEYAAWCAAERSRDVQAVPAPELHALFTDYVERVFESFPRDALKLSFLAAVAYADLRELLERRLGWPEADAALPVLVSALDNDITMEQNHDLCRIAGGDLPRAEFLERFGHRATQEMELARPRWWEEPGVIDRLAGAMPPERREQVASKIAAQRAAFEDTEKRILARVRSQGGEAATNEFRDLLRETRALLPWRENWKHYWMMGFDLVRRILLELDRRWELDGLVFYFTRAELGEVARADGHVNRELQTWIRERRQDDRVAHTVRLPEFFTAEEIDEVFAADSEAGSQAGAVPAAETPGDAMQGSPIAAGQAAGLAWTCESPDDDFPLTNGGHGPPPYILVCRTTDPGWTPLLAGAQALVVEQGGVLSHGAIVCRDFGLPAVVVPDATRRIATGDRLHVDGTHGSVERVTEESGEAPVDEARARDEAEAAGEWKPGPEPYVSPPPAWLGGRVALGITLAIVASVLVLSIASWRGAFLVVMSWLLDWTFAAGLSPFWRIFVAAAGAGLIATGLALLVTDRARLGALRDRLRWYRRELRRLRKAEKRAQRAKRAATVRREIAVARQALARRHRQASGTRSLELLRPIGWSFLPFCLSFLWVQEKMSTEPIYPGTTFRVRAYFQPLAAGSYLRRARLDVDTPGRVQFLDAPFQKLQSNEEAPHLGPYTAVWSFNARVEGPLTFRVVARDDVREVRTFVIAEKAAPTAGDSGGTTETAPRQITGVNVETSRLRVALPEPVHRACNALVEWVAGVGVTPDQTASGPITTFLVLAIVLALVLQRGLGIR